MYYLLWGQENSAATIIRPAVIFIKKILYHWRRRKIVLSLAGGLSRLVNWVGGYLFGCSTLVRVSLFCSKTLEKFGKAWNNARALLVSISVMKKKHKTWAPDSHGQNPGSENFQKINQNNVERYFFRGNSTLAWKVQHQFMGKYKSMTPSSLSPLFVSNLFWGLSNKFKQLVAGCVMEGFHDVLPKEHRGAFYDTPWGL